MIEAIPGESPEQTAARKKKLFQQTKAVGITFPEIDPNQLAKLLASIAKFNQKSESNGEDSEEEVEVIPEPDFDSVEFHPNNTI
jgi:hypothetical protein